MLRIIDGFDHHADGETVDSLPKVGRVSGGTGSTQSAIFSVAGARDGAGKCFNNSGAAFAYSTDFNAHNGVIYDISDMTIAQKLVFGFAFYTDAINTDSPICGCFGNSFGAWIFSIGLNSDGSLKIWDGTHTQILNFSSAPAIQAHKWSYIEVEMQIASVDTSYSAAPTTSIYVDTVLAGSFQSQNAQFQSKIILGAGANGNNNRVYCGYGSYFDDLYMLTDQGDNPVARLGNSRVETLFPATEDTLVDFTRTGGTGPNDTIGAGSEDTGTYYYGLNAGDQALFKAGSDLTSVTGSTIHGVGVLQLADRVDTSATRAMAPSIKENSVVTAGQSYTFTSANTYEFAQSCFALQPSDGSAWTKAKVNAMAFGVKITA